MNITEIASKKTSGVESLSTSLTRAAGLTSDASPFADELNSQFSFKTQNAQRLASRKGAMHALSSQIAAGSQQTSAKSEAHAKAQKAAQGLVSNALILPILKQIRRSQNERKGYFSPGNGEKTFGPEFDMQISDRIAQSPNLAITKSLTDRLEKRSATPAAATSNKGQQKLDVHG